MQVTKRVGLVHSGPHHHLIENLFSQLHLRVMFQMIVTAGIITESHP
jgi:hypothetical protein